MDGLHSIIEINIVAHLEEEIWEKLVDVVAFGFILANQKIVLRIIAIG